ncbi:hypothetical protein, partial [Roseibium sp. RKSG952]
MLFHCKPCGHEGNADMTAARNFLTSGTRPAPRERVKARQQRESR